MTTPVKIPNLQAHQVLLYDRALHPELFPLRKRRVVRHDGGPAGEGSGYELEAWVMDGAHLLRFEHGPLCASELLWEDESRFPASGILNAHLCIAEREYEHRFARASATYMNTVQNENLSESLYRATYHELLDHGRENEALIQEWADEAGPCLSMVETQRYHREVHAHCFHMVAAQNGLVLRTQTLFELN
jgi:hypothetical protein